MNQILKAGQRATIIFDDESILVYNLPTMAKKSKRWWQPAKKLAKSIFMQPAATLVLAVGLILLVAWLGGGFSRSIDQSTEPGSLSGVQTLPQSPVSVAPPPPPELLWQGMVQPVIIPPNTTPVLYKIPISEPVVFLSIDDGWAKPDDAQQWLISHRLPFSLFLTDDAIKSNYGYFQKLQTAGLVIENHTLHHSRLNKFSLARQQAEICGAADTFKGVFAARPTLFRPPYGLMNGTTLQAAGACSMRAIVMWHASVENGVIHYQAGDHLLPGDIVLMHFHSNMTADLQAFFNQVRQDHLQVGRLEDWVK